VGIYGLKPAFRRSLAPLLRAFPRLSPNAVSLAAVGVAALAAVALLLAPQRHWLWLLVPLLVFVRLALNALDGMLAQAQGSSSRRGELVNELSDRVSDTLILGALALSGAVPLVAGAAALVATLLVSYAGILEKAAGGVRNYAGPMGKADRMALLALGCVLAFAGIAQALLWTCWLMAALALVTLANRVRLAWGRLGEGP